MIRRSMAHTCVPFRSPPGQSRAQLRLRSLSWALLAAAGAGALALGLGLAPGPFAATGPAEALEAGLRAGGCGFFYGLLAFHLQRVDPDDDHLQGGLVGAVCGIRSLAAPAALPGDLAAELPGGLPAAMMELLRGWLPLWLPLVGSALLLHVLQTHLPALRPGSP